MADDSRWRPGKPLRIIPVGDTAAASEWIPFARRKMVELSRFGDYARRTWQPADGVVIRGEMLSGIPRVFIEVEGGLTTFLFEYTKTELMTIRGANSPLKPFRTVYTNQFTDGTNWATEPGVRYHVPLEDGIVFQRDSTHSFSEVYVLKNNKDNPTPAYVTSMVDINNSARRICYVSPSVWGLFNQFNFLRFDIDGALLGNSPIPASPPQFATAAGIAVVNLGDNRLMFRRDYVRFDSGFGTFPPEYAYSSDGGTSWSLVPAPPIFERATLALSDGLTVVALKGFSGQFLQSRTSLDGGLTWSAPSTEVTISLGEQIFPLNIERGLNNSAYALIQHTANPYFILRLHEGAWIRLPPIPGINPIGASYEQDHVGGLVIISSSDDPAKSVLGLPVWYNGLRRVVLLISADGGTTWKTGPTLKEPYDSSDFAALHQHIPIIVGRTDAKRPPTTNNPYE